jgi:hypothetical protein
MIFCQEISYIYVLPEAIPSGKFYQICDSDIRKRTGIESPSFCPGGWYDAIEGYSIKCFRFINISIIGEYVILIFNM